MWDLNKMVFVPLGNDWINWGDLTGHRYRNGTGRTHLLAHAGNKCRALCAGVTDPVIGAFITGACREYWGFFPRLAAWAVTVGLGLFCCHWWHRWHCHLSSHFPNASELDVMGGAGGKQILCLFFLISAETGVFHSMPVCYVNCNIFLLFKHILWLLISQLW